MERQKQGICQDHYPLFTLFTILLLLWDPDQTFADNYTKSLCLKKLWENIQLFNKYSFRFMFYHITVRIHLNYCWSYSKLYLRFHRKLNHQLNQYTVKLERFVRNFSSLLKNSIQLRDIKVQKQPFWLELSYSGLMVSGILTLCGLITSSTSDSISLTVWQVNCCAAVCSSSDRGER